MAKSYLTTCCLCHRTTSKQYARKNGGKCKSCVTGVKQPRREREPRPVCHGEMTHAFLSYEASLDACPY